MAERKTRNRQEIKSLLTMEVGDLRTERKKGRDVYRTNKKKKTLEPERTKLETFG